MKSVVHNSELASELSSVARRADELIAQSKMNLFNACHLTFCPRYVVGVALGFEDSHKEESEDVFSRAIKDVWLERLGMTDNIVVLHRNFLAVDTMLQLMSHIDVVVRILDTPTIIKFRYVSADVLDEVKQRGVLKKDVVEMAAGMYMTQSHAACVVYSNDGNDVVFHVMPRQEIVQAIKNKCRDLTAYAMLRILPKCRYTNRSQMCLCQRLCSATKDSSSGGLNDQLKS